MLGAVSLGAVVGGFDVDAARLLVDVVRVVAVAGWTGLLLVAAAAFVVFAACSGVGSRSLAPSALAGPCAGAGDGGAVGDAGRAGRVAVVGTVSACGGTSAPGER